jgi:uncharacterized membrane protein
VGAVGRLGQDVGVPREAGARFLALDFLRVLAVGLMVQGHVFHVVLEDAVRAESWFRWHRYVHGFTAPLFFFSSGLAFTIATLARWDEHLRPGAETGRRVRRYLSLILIGYLLHLPGMSLQGVLAPRSPEELSLSLRVDALHHLGVMLLACELLVMALRERRRFAMTAGCLGAAAVLAAPFVWRLPTGELPPLLAAYLSDATGSFFPLVPWCGFVAAGVVTGHLLRDPSARAPLPLVAVGIAFVVAGDLARRSGLDPFGEHDFWRTSPYWFAVRLGVVLIALGASSALQRALAARGVHRVALFERIGAETLVVYVAHLLVLYGTPFHRGLDQTVRRTLGLAHSTLLFAALLAGTALLAYGWHVLRRRRPEEHQRLRWALAVTALGIALRAVTL